MQGKQPDITRDRILDAAYKEIHRHGFQAASIANILADTGLTKGALYHHFPAKQDLGLAVIDEVVRAGLEEMVFEPLRTSRDPLDTLLELIRRKGEKATVESVSLGCPLNNLMQEMSPLDDEFKRRLTAILGTWQEAVTTALETAQARATLRRDVDCKAVALFIVSAWEGCVGIAKNTQSIKTYRLCMQQLHDYVSGLRSARRKSA